MRGNGSNHFLLARLPDVDLAVDQRHPAAKSGNSFLFVSSPVASETDVVSASRTSMRARSAVRPASSCAAMPEWALANSLVSASLCAFSAAMACGLIFGQFVAECGSLRGNSGEALGRQLFELTGLFRQMAERFGNRVAQGFDLALAGLAEFVKPLETGDHFLKLGMGGAPGIADIVGHIAGRIGDHRQLSAQLFHIVECGGADAAD